MKKTALLLSMIVCQILAYSQKTEMDGIAAIEQRLDTLQVTYQAYENRLQQISATVATNKRQIREVCQRNEELNSRLDSLQQVCTILEGTQITDRTAMQEKIQETNNMLAFSQSVVKNRTWWGGGIAFALLMISAVLTVYFAKRIKVGASSIDEVRKAQDSLHSAYLKMQEESVKLDNQMLDLIAKQMPVNNVPIAKVDHSLALKVADEIVRIEQNMSHMDSSIKGYKQLAKAVQRIKDNFYANGYEIVDMLGKPYVPGMIAEVTFVAGNNLAPNQQIITKIIKPQINYNRQMIQAAQIEVTQ